MKFYSNETQELLADLGPREVLEIVKEEMANLKVSKNLLAKVSGIPRKRVTRIFNGGLARSMELRKFVFAIESQPK